MEGVAALLGLGVEVADPVLPAAFEEELPAELPALRRSLSEESSLRGLGNHLTGVDVVAAPPGPALVETGWPTQEVLAKS